MTPITQAEPIEAQLSARQNQTLDPPDWECFRKQAHRMLDDMIDYTKNIRQRPIWQPAPEEVRGRFRNPVPAGPTSLAEVHEEFMNSILPYAAGNVHPGFMGNNAERFSRLPGVVTPITASLPRERLADSQAASTLAGYGLKFPLLLRAPGLHTGQHFLKVESFEALLAALAGLAGREIIVMEYLDARGADGKTRKYRVMMIDGQLHPLHLAISSHWKIHYFTAEMAENPAHRAEDAAFLENMPGVLGAAAMGTLERIQSMLGLDYAGIDFGLNAKGEVLVFEANATMAVNPPGAEECWNYRLPVYQRIREAVQKMLLERASRRVA
jgi:hypothetical protein